MVLTCDWARQRGASHSPLLAAVVSGTAAPDQPSAGRRGPQTRTRCRCSCLRTGDG